eukprot:Polyplicarium_translucidae@DN3342_c3_g2_i4.p1
MSPAPGGCCVSGRALFPHQFGVDNTFGAAKRTVVRTHIRQSLSSIRGGMASRPISKEASSSASFPARGSSADHTMTSSCAGGSAIGDPMGKGPPPLMVSIDVLEKSDVKAHADSV